MKRTHTFILLALLLAGAYALHAKGYLYAVGGVGTYVGWRFAFTLTLFFVTAAVGAALPRWRLPIVFGSSLLHLFVMYLPLKATVALAIWTAFYQLVHLRLSWWLKGIPVLALYAAPFLLIAFDPTSALNGALVVTFCASNFALRSVLYAYEATKKRELFQGTGLVGYLLCLVVSPLTVVNFAPIGFLVLLRGLRKEHDQSMLWRGVKEIALGVAFLTVFQIGSNIGALPDYMEVALAADELNALTAFAACHLLLLKFFLKVAGDIHLAVGMLRVLGFDIAPGTERPLLARNILEFWRRWNTYYRDYLLTLGYYPVAAALKRRPMLAAAAGGAAAFILSGFAHIVQFLVRHPREFTLQRFLEGHVWALVFGAFVIVWMLREMKRPRLPGARAGGEKEAGPWMRLRQAGAVVATLSVVSLILMLYYPPLLNSQLSTCLGVLKAFLRFP